MNIFMRLALLFFLFSSSAVFATPLLIVPYENVTHIPITDNRFSIQQKDKDTTVIRFDYKQSALYHTYTFEALDSVVTILLKNNTVKLSIEGYAYKDEGSDTICYYLSLNRALFIKTYILGRGIDSSRIISIHAYGNTRQQYKNTDKGGLTVNCRAEILLNYPPPPPKKLAVKDRDEDGIVDSEDKCPDEFGYKENNGCPNKDAVIIPFETQQSSLFSRAYKVLDSVIAVLSGNSSLTVSIEGHAYKAEGISSVCDQLASERASIVKQYLLSRRIDVSRINSVKGYGNSRPINAGKNPQEIIANSRAEIILSNSQKL